MIKIGITGGIGTGKTTICRVFELLGVPVFYADAAAKQAMQTDTMLIENLKAVFGSKSYTTDGVLDRRYLAGIVFGNEEQLQKLNALVHPAVFRAFDAWVEKQDSVYVIKEAALLFESQSYKDCHATILVKSPEALRIHRVATRDHITKDEVRARMSRQWTDEEKARLADFILNNDERQLLIPQLLTLHQRFLSGTI
ncbi:dephospho-CoA kinase [Pedobacter sp. SYSU D00535]|uniref:dephospho-CoA kinase n=1 Tax=Pedobacter sp. SYSU D00535 TaxID=2810308 RepID=UPI001A96EE64|nr:dephospho-CoA kinase [Pedobacter sp. SYSU D00535]